jgi:hypothetical protein
MQTDVTQVITVAVYARLLLFIVDQQWEIADEYHTLTISMDDNSGSLFLLLCACRLRCDSN